VAIKPFNSSNTFTLPDRWHGLLEQDENGVHNLDCNQRADGLLCTVRALHTAGRYSMPYIFPANDNVHHQAQRPQGRRADNGERRSTASLHASRLRRTDAFDTASKAQPRISSVL
jgi:hypothetical protein